MTTRSISPPGPASDPRDGVLGWIILRTKLTIRRHQFRIAVDDWIGALLEGEQDVQAHRQISAGADVARFHDAAPRAGDHHPAMASHRSSERHRLLISRVGRSGSG